MRQGGIKSITEGSTESRQPYLVEEHVIKISLAGLGLAFRVRIVEAHGGAGAREADLGEGDIVQKGIVYM